MCSRRPPTLELKFQLNLTLAQNLEGLRKIEGGAARRQQLSSDLPGTFYMLSESLILLKFKFAEGLPLE